MGGTGRASLTADWLTGGGELGALMRAHDWAGTPLGPAEAWPQSLRSAVSILLPSKAQICLFWGPELVAIYNDAYRPALGRKHPWALGRPAREMWSEFWEDVLRPLLEGVLKTGEALWASNYPFALERHGFPEETYFDISYDPVRDESGGVGGIFCIVSETTGRVIGERRLRLLRDLGRATHEARSVDGVFHAAAGVLGGSAHDLPFAQLLDPKGKPLAACGIASRDDWPFERAVDCEAELRAADLAQLGPLPGGPWAEATHTVVILPIATPGQPPAGYLVAGISPRLVLDEAYRDFLRLVSGSLASGVAAARALEEQRAQAEALAEIDRAKTAFFSNVSHEFRTPLTLMLGPLDDALADRETPAPPRQRERLELIRRNALRLQRLVNALLDFSRIEAGRAQAHYAPTDLAKLTAELASNFSTACEKAGLTLTVDCPPLGEPVYVDRGMWEKIVLNLLSNAFKFTFEGGIRVSIQSADGGVELRVADTGSGIPAGELPRIFERFHRVEGLRSRTHEGSGIGLAFVRELARLHGGDIEATSEPGRGSTFTVRLPLGKTHLPSERIVDTGRPTTSDAPAFVQEAMGWLSDGSVGAGPATAASPEARILMVDDNADMRDYVTRLLRSRWAVTTARNGREALELIAQHDYDLVLSDVMMPEVDGFALLQAIRARPGGADLPVVLLSARAGEESRLDGLTAGADDYIIKPFTAQQLIAQIGAQLTIRRAHRKSAEERERQREQLYSLFMQAPNPIVILRGEDYVIELANPAACAVWGRRHEEVIARRLYDVMPELEGQGFRELLDAVLTSGVPYEGKETPARFRDAGGGERTVYFNFVYTPLRGADERIEGILVTAFDVTDQVTARQQMSTLQGQAESASRAKDEFLAMLSHELRNPLAPIFNAIQVMRLRGAEVPELGTLERQVAHLRRLVDDLLDVSRITRGKIELRRSNTEIGDAVLRAMEMASPMLESRAHRVDISGVARHGLAVHGDPERLAQVVFNLLSNAAKYSDPGSTITLRASREMDRVFLSVCDRGMGISPEMIGRVFDIFVQQPQTLERSGGGLGLGLAIVRSLVELHGGRVAVRSGGVGQGSEFTIDLPAATAATAITARNLPPMPRTARGTARRLVVVDDNIDAALALVELLRSLGHRVEVAHDGPRALAVARALEAEVALVDIGLPGMDGYELARRLHEQQPELLLIAVTGYGLDRDRQRSAQAGFAHHLVKPIEMTELTSLLEAPLPPSGTAHPIDDRAST